MYDDRCIACGGSGDCPECFGSGVNVHLNSDEPKCQTCKGRGVCKKCGGTGQNSVGLGGPLITLDLD